ncbi:uncharacterized protein TNCV_1512711 [Trichonephila clavipes]|nr:uncharacterized protein TNCV_1512711 [Trichonephila clavipes]
MRAFGDGPRHFYHGQVMWTTPELVHPLLTAVPHQREDVSALDRFSVHRCPKTAATRGLLATDHVILNHGQVTWTTPELAPPLLTTTPHQREDVSALDRFNVHRCPTRRVFSGTGIELMTCLPWLDTLTTRLPQPCHRSRSEILREGMSVCHRERMSAHCQPGARIAFHSNQFKEKTRYAEVLGSIIRVIWKWFRSQKVGWLPDQTARGGRVRSTTPAEDRYIVLSAKRNRRTTAQQVANQFLAASGKQISRKTVARCLREEDYTHADLLCVSH